MKAIFPNKTHSLTIAPRTDHDIPAKWLRTGHCRLRSHMKKIGIEKSALCPCGLEAQTTVHVLQSSPLHKRERESTWPTESSLGNNCMEQPPTYA